MNMFVGELRMLDRFKIIGSTIPNKVEQLKYPRQTREVKVY